MTLICSQFRVSDRIFLIVILKVTTLQKEGQPNYINALTTRNFYELSGGEQQRVLIARALAQEVEVLLLDEPTSNLDIRHQLEVMDIIRNLKLNEKITIVIAIHDLNLAAKFCDKIIMMKEGKILLPEKLDPF